MSEQKGKLKPQMPVSEIEELVVKLAKEGNPPSKIGVVLRDQYGVPSVKLATGKDMVEILAARGVKPEIPEDLFNLLKKAVRLHRHLERNRRDKPSKRSLECVEARIVKLARYYVREGVLPKGWRYDRERAALLVR
jgi:small subunit ribosomal protein S15